MRAMKMVLLGAGSAAMLAVGGTMPAGAASQGGETAASASAPGTSAKGVGAAAWSCTKGAVCLYKGANGTGRKYERFVNTNNNYYGINSVRNNGDTSESRDHVNIKWNWTGSDQSHWNCLPPEGRWNFPNKSITVDAIRWVKSC
ncbi:peptidase inhibitor family I36 protein [Streptomyces sp. AS02]|uniref:peptidase inhibitor family I36 protein n=1 Tax=Streptomyces sp. AS02 TaxID=2938946 RepID=UPI00202112C1|nr:peptidase inhibitor family I36 protein [Streptomyces sp. AS02]MCL8017096.1 peptidase inhibitor family I36 protein [Streptomyces sp. AS02]